MPDVVAEDAVRMRLERGCSCASLHWLPAGTRPFMDPGEMVTRWTIRLTLALFAGALAAWLAGGGPVAGVWARRAWTAGLLLYLAHVAAAFHVFHNWSHQAAW